MGWASQSSPPEFWKMPVGKGGEAAGRMGGADKIGRVGTEERLRFPPQTRAGLLPGAEQGT
jgi:hypothetical protein